MDSTPAIQIYINVSIIVFLGFAAVLFYLLVRLLTSQTLLRRAQEKLHDYAVNLEKKVEERTAELTISESKYRTLFESSKEAILVVSCETDRILDYNSTAVALFGNPALELDRSRFSDLQLVKLASDSEREWEEYALKREDGSNRFLDCIISQINYADQDCRQIICRDVTEKRELEAQLIQSQKLTGLGQLAAGVAHELNTPLGIIYTSTYYLKNAIKEQTPKIKKHFEIIEGQITRGQKIIQDLRNFSRAPDPAVELVKCNLNEIIDNNLRLIEKEISSNGITLIREFGTLPSLLIDPSRISQVFFNLIMNALQAMPSGGTLSIKSWLAKDIQDSKGIRINPEEIVICVHDTGVGIPPEILPKIFTPFFTTKEMGDGVGLGLSVSYGIVKQFQGELQVESEPELGTKFYVTLPVR